MDYKFEKTKLPEVILITPKTIKDERGFLVNTFDRKEFEKNGVKGDFFREFLTLSKKNVIRGLHFQRKPYEFAKIVRCLKGEIFDVVVDVRSESPTVGKFVSFILSETNKQMAFIPRGFAHGFLVLSEEALVDYKLDNVYSPEHEAGLLWNDKDVAIPWPLKRNPIVPTKDQKLPTLRWIKDNI